MTESIDQAVVGVPGWTRNIAKRGLEQTIWARVALARRSRELPTAVPPTDLLRDASQWRQAVSECSRLGLPKHHDGPKNWDALSAVSTVLHELGTDIRVIDAGAARYSTVLTSLAIYGVRELVGNNLEFRRTYQHGDVRFEPGDVTEMMYRDGWFDAVTCMSVIEHGVPVEEFLAESARVLRNGGLLIVSTDYAAQPPDATGKTAYGVPVRIFSSDDIKKMVEYARTVGLELVGDLQLDGAGEIVHWARLNLDYTFIKLAFRRCA